MKKQLWLVISIAAVVAAGGVIYFTLISRDAEEINSFDTCVAGGGRVYETFPEQCVTKDGKHFVQIVSEE